MKKIGLLLVVGFMVFGSMAFAAEASTPAEIYADLTGKTVEEAYEKRGQGRFGALAREDGVSEEFVAQMLEAKKVQILALVGDRLTQEEADELIAKLEAQIAECDGTGSQVQLLQGVGMRFGNSQGAGNGLGTGDRLGNGQGEGYGNANAKGQGGNRGNRQGTQDGTCVIQ